MIYLNPEYSEYKYLVDWSDNYYVLSNRSSIHGESGDPETINTFVQYLSPSFYGFSTTYSSELTRSFPDVSSSCSDSLFDRADFPVIFICNFITIFIFAFILNQLTKLVKKGGVFGSN